MTVSVICTQCSSCENTYIWGMVEDFHVDVKEGWSLFTCRGMVYSKTFYGGMVYAKAFMKLIIVYILSIHALSGCT